MVKVIAPPHPVPARLLVVAVTANLLLGAGAVLTRSAGDGLHALAAATAAVLGILLLVASGALGHLRSRCEWRRPWDRQPDRRWDRHSGAGATPLKSRAGAEPQRAQAGEEVDEYVDSLLSDLAS